MAASTKAAVAKKPRSHPPYAEMIKEAIVALKERTGSSQYAIAKHIEDNHKDLAPNFKKLLLVQLKKLVAAGILTKVKYSFKLGSIEKPKAKPAEEKKAPAKKTVAPAAKKKVSAPKAKAGTPVKAKKTVAKARVKKTPVKAVKKTPLKTVKKTPLKTVKKAAAKKPKSIKSPAKKVAAKKAKK